MNPPESIGRYTIVSQLGKGGMAEVYLAEDTMMKRQVALKLLPKLFMHDPQFKSRFEREAQVVAQLEHPAVVTVYDFGYHDEQPYMVSRYMRGGSLLQRIQSQGAFSLEEAMEMVVRVAGALDESHSRGIVHRDLKPANILFDEAGRAYVADFGIAKVIEATSAMTGNALIGTPAYMSPEQFGGEHELDGRSDEYALGIILFEMLSGELPFKGDTTAKLMKQHLMDAPVALSSLRGDVPAGLEAVLMRALAKDPGERFATLGEFAMALAAATGSAPAGPGTRPAPIATKAEREDIYATNLAPVTQVEVDVPDLGQSEDEKQQSAAGPIRPTSQTENGTPAGKKKRGVWVGCLMALVITGVVVVGLGMAGIVSLPFLYDYAYEGSGQASTTDGQSVQPVTQASPSSQSVAPTATTRPAPTVTTRPTATARPVIGGGTGWLIFAVYGFDGEDDQIFKVFHDGSDLEQVDSYPELRHHRSESYWSGSDEYLYSGQAYSMADFDIYLRQADGSYRNLTIDSGSDNDYAAFSPDGQQIAFASNRGRGQFEYHIYVMDRDGRNVQQLTTGPGTYVAPSWSPDGEWIAFLGNESTSGYINVGTTLYIMRADGSDLTEIVTDTPVYYYLFPSWQP